MQRSFCTSSGNAKIVCSINASRVYAIVYIKDTKIDMHGSNNISGWDVMDDFRLESCIKRKITYELAKIKYGFAPTSNLINFVPK